jgi:N6-L-threonylcarbamoyladenine synthase
MGGVVPMIARRAHIENIEGVYKEALKRARLKIEDIEYIAVTYGPGLAIDLEVGVNFAKDLAKKYNKQFMPINHMEGHLLSSFSLNSKGKGLIETIDTEKIFPAVGVLVSGSHTELILVKDFGKYERIGETLDDAAGEAFDKVGRMLDLGFPGGHIVSEFAKKGKKGNVVFSVPMMHSNDYNLATQD